MDWNWQQGIVELEAKLRELESALASKDLLIARLVEQNTDLKGQVEELKRRLNLDSSNSSKPPSSDDLRKKPAPKSLRTTSGKDHVAAPPV